MCAIYILVVIIIIMIIIIIIIIIISLVCTSIVVYADDTILVAPSMHAQQLVIHLGYGSYFD